MIVVNCTKVTMSQENIATVVKILESLPDTQQERVIEYLREYISDLGDELQCQESEENTDDVWQAYLQSKEEREEVYRHLANS